MQCIEPCRLPPTPSPPGKRLSCIQRLLGWEGWGGGKAAGSPVPGRANLGLVGQHYKYLLLRDSVTQPRSRKGKRCPRASPLPPGWLRGTAGSPGVPPSPGSRPGHWGAERRSGWQSGGRIVRASAGSISATSTEKGQCQSHESPIWSRPRPFFPPHCYLHKHSTSKTTSSRAAKPLQGTPPPTPTHIFTRPRRTRAFCTP